MVERVGRRDGVWMNSYAMVGHTLAEWSMMATADEEVVEEAAPTSGRLANLVEADQAGALSKRLRRDPAGLDRFLDDQVKLHRAPPHKVLAMMKAELAKQAIDGKPIHSWKFFAGTVADELHRENLEAEGIRPGDVMGAHKRRV